LALRVGNLPGADKAGPIAHSGMERSRTRARSSITIDFF